MKKNIRKIFVITLCSILIGFISFIPTKSIDFSHDASKDIKIVCADGHIVTVVVTMTPENGPGSYIAGVIPFSVQNLDAYINTKNANGGYLVPGQTYYAAGSPTTKPTSSSTPSTPKAEAKNEEQKCEHECTSEATTEPTCKDKGVKTFTCSKCGDSYTEEIDVTDNHDFVEEIVKEATCTEEGESKKVCSICRYEETSIIPKLEHQYKEEITKEPTCTENGAKTFTCELCGDSYTEDIEATGHSEGQFEVTQASSIFANGEQVKKCTVCVEVLATEVIPAKYPMWYLYCGIGLLVVAIAAIAGIVIKKKK